VPGDARAERLAVQLLALEQTLAALLVGPGGAQLSEHVVEPPGQGVAGGLGRGLLGGVCGPRSARSRAKTASH
jgi:hypothetical protein